MKQKRIMLIPNEAFYKIQPINLICESHISGFSKISFETGLFIPENLSNSHDISYYLVELGFCVIMYDKNNDIENAIIYVPLEISEKQELYLNRLNDKLFSKCDLLVNALTEEKKLCPYDNQITDEPITEILKKLIEERTQFPKPTKNKKL